MLHYKICVTLVLVFVLTAVVLVMIGFQEVVKHTITNLLVKLKILSGMLGGDRKSTRLNSSHQIISYAVFCLKKKTQFQLPLLATDHKGPPVKPPHDPDDE